jgi:hypothetical protein
MTPFGAAAAAADPASVDALEVLVRKLAAGRGSPVGPLRQLNRQARRAEQAVSFVSRVFQASGGDWLEGAGLGEHHSIPGRLGERQWHIRMGTMA